MISESPVRGVHRVLLHPRLTYIFCDPFHFSDPKINPFSNLNYFVRQLWFASSFRWLRESTGLIWSQAKHLTTISIFLPHWPRPMTLIPFLRYFWSYLCLALGGIQSALKKMILDCKFQILGIKNYCGSLYNHIFQKFFLSISNINFFTKLLWDYWCSLYAYEFYEVWTTSKTHYTFL